MLVYASKIHLYSAAFAYTRHTSSSAALSSQSGPTFSHRPQQAKLSHTDFDLFCHTAAHSPYSLSFKWLLTVILVNPLITTHLPTPEGWKAELA